MKFGDANIGAQRSKAMNVRVAKFAPVDKLNTQFEGAIGFSDEFILINF